MPDSLDQFAKSVLSGQSRSPGALALRSMLAVIEPGYAAVMAARNGLYDRGLLRSHLLGRTTLSVGNLTAGGTGKTPVVRWMAETMRGRGHHPAILLRGYMRQARIESDEATLLRRQLRVGRQTHIEVEANPDRVAAASAVLARSPQTDLFILDDAFQHRRAHRDFDLVLIDAGEPFGYGHVHPRGLLRESKRGLRRADAVLLTRCAQVSEAELESLRNELLALNPNAPVFASTHHHAAIVDEQGGQHDIRQLAGRRFFAFSGIARPEALHRQLQAWQGGYVGHRWFGDHHTYTDGDRGQIIAEAKACGAEMLLTTGKDAVKLSGWSDSCKEAGLPLYTLDLRIKFFEEDEEKLTSLILSRAGLGNASAPPVLPAPAG